MATIPTAYTWTVGELLTSAKLNTYLRDAVSFLLSRPTVRLTHTTTQAITTSAATALNFNTEDEDTDSMHSTTTNISRATVQTAGVWAFTAAAPWDANTTGKRECYLRVNGTTIYGGSSFSAGLTIAHSHSVSIRFRANVADFVEAVVLQTSGGNLNIDPTFHGGQRLTGIWERT